jgi:AraC family transcriptional regulator
MSSTNEPGVLPESAIYFFTPSDMAKNLLFYVTRCGHYFCDNRYSFSSRSELGSAANRLNFLLFYVVKGSLALEFDNRTYAIGQDQVAFIDCHQPHFYYAPESVEFLWVHFDGVNARQFYDQIITSRGKQVFAVPAKGDLYRYILKIIACSYNVRGLPEIEHSLTLYKILCNLLFAPQSSLEPGDDESPISQAVSYIEQNLFSDLSVGAAAESVNLSYAHFCRLFRRQTGYSPKEYIVIKRISQAKYLLNTTNLSIKEIAFTVGYNSETNFISSFITKVGISPGTFRKNPF